MVKSPYKKVVAVQMVNDGVEMLRSVFRLQAGVRIISAAGRPRRTGFGYLIGLQDT